MWWMLASLALGAPADLQQTTEAMFAAFDEGRGDEAVELARSARAMAVAQHGRASDEATSAADNLAFLLQATGQLDESLALLEATLAMREATLPAEDPRLATARNNLGFSYVQAGLLDEAHPLFAAAAEDHRRSGALDELTTDLNNLAFVESQLGAPEQALAHMREAVDVTRQLVGDGSPVVAVTLSTLVESQLRTGRLDGALEACEEAVSLFDGHPEVDVMTWAEAEARCAEVQIAQGDRTGLARMERTRSRLEDSLGADSPEYALLLQLVSQLLETIGDVEEALAVNLEALERARAIGDPQLLAQALNNVGMVQVSVGQPEAAEQNLIAALETWDASIGISHPHAARCLMNLGVARSDLGRFKEAQRTLLDSLELLDAIGGLPRYQVDTLLALGHVEGELGLHEQARGHLEQAITLARALGEPQGIASVLNNLGNQTYARGDEVGALRFFEEAMALWTQPEHPNFATLQGNVGLLYAGLGQPEQAEHLLEAALALHQRVGGPDHPLVADVLSQQAGVAALEDDLERALALQQQSLDIRRKALGPEHSGVAEAMSRVALFQSRLGRAEADQTYADAVALMRRSLGDAHPAWPPIQADQAEQLRERGERTQALALLDEAVQRQLEQLPALLEGASESEQLRLLHQQRRTLDRELAWRTDPEHQEQVWAHLMAWKGLVREGLRWRQEDGDPASAELRQVRRQLAHLSLSPIPAAGTEARRAELDALLARRDQLQRALSLEPEPAPPPPRCRPRSPLGRCSSTSSSAPSTTTRSWRSWSAATACAGCRWAARARLPSRYAPGATRSPGA